MFKAPAFVNAKAQMKKFDTVVDDVSNLDLFKNPLARSFVSGHPVADRFLLRGGGKFPPNNRVNSGRDCWKSTRN